ncbi:MAG: CxxC-x17-CxxC domain-containing protein [Candidatus Bathyarchaeia archaeon]|jgi:CxxC-x17-CxxC domain-containing protein
MFQKRMFEVICTDCGQTTTVPFKPTAGKPVYCRTCFSKHMLKRSENEGMNFSFDSKQAWARRGDDWKGRSEQEPTNVFNR